MRPGSNLAPGTGGLAHPSKVHSQSRYIHRGRGEVQRFKTIGDFAFLDEVATKPGLSDLAPRQGR